MTFPSAEPEVLGVSEESNTNQLVLDPEYLKQIGSRIEEIKVNDQPFLQAEFNLVHLAVQSNFPAHHLAVYFRETRKQTFSEYRNGWRIEYVKKLIQSGEFSEITLEAIGKRAGFNSRNSFLTAFKKQVGMSPSAYVASLK